MDSFSFYPQHKKDCLELDGFLLYSWIDSTHLNNNTSVGWESLPRFDTKKDKWLHSVLMPDYPDIEDYKYKFRKYIDEWEKKYMYKIENGKINYYKKYKRNKTTNKADASGY